MSQYRYWKPDAPVALAEWIEGELESGEFDDAIGNMIKSDPDSFADLIVGLIEKGEFDDAVLDRARALGLEEAK